MSGCISLDDFIKPSDLGLSDPPDLTNNPIEPFSVRSQLQKCKVCAWFEAPSPFGSGTVEGTPCQYCLRITFGDYLLTELNKMET